MFYALADQNKPVRFDSFKMAHVLIGDAPEDRKVCASTLDSKDQFVKLKPCEAQNGELHQKNNHDEVRQIA